MDAFFIYKSFVYLFHDTRRFKSNLTQHFKTISDNWSWNQYVFVYRNKSRTELIDL